MTLTDTHTHLYDLDDGELRAVMSDAATAGVDMIVNTAVSVDTSKKVLAQCALFPNNMKAAVGISPFDTENVGSGWADELDTLLTNPLAAAVGEIGLDCTNPRYPPLDTQMPVFLKQLDIAMETGLPAVIHSRGMEKRTAKICGDIGVRKAVFHCFTGDREAMEYIISKGFYISISGIVTYKNSHLREIIKDIPKDRLLIETDAPYLSPVPHRGKTNVPAFIVHTAQEIANILEIDMTELSEELRNNTASIFAI